MECTCVNHGAVSALIQDAHRRLRGGAKGAEGAVH